jgi:hypothetical protein
LRTKLDLIIFRPKWSFVKSVPDEDGTVADARLAEDLLHEGEGDDAHDPDDADEAIVDAHGHEGEVVPGAEERQQDAVRVADLPDLFESANVQIIFKIRK